ncbi:MAG: NAD(P)H-hydrate dehydratase [bacterium]
MAEPIALDNSAMSTANHNLSDLVFTAREMAEVDRTTIEDIGIPGMVLMEHAGLKVVSVILDVLGDSEGKKIVVVCGKGNNGGDGYVVARHLLNRGAQVKVVLVADPKEVKGDAAQNLRILTHLQAKVETFSRNKHGREIASADFIVDALLGTGVAGALKPKFAELVELINNSPAPVISVDLPTGMATDTGAVFGGCVRADHTVTLGHLKRGLLFSPAREHAGTVHVADIGFPPGVSRGSGVTCFRTSREYIKQVLPVRRKDAFKNRCGQVLLLAGSAGMTGAATLSSEAVLRIGAGLAMLGIPKSLNPVLEQKLIEVMTLPLPETDDQSLSFQATEFLPPRLKWADVLAVGPGLTTHPESVKLVNWLLANYDKTTVLDADGLNCLATDPDVLSTRKCNLILTPHPGELSRLAKIGSKEILADPLEVARKVAADLDAVMVLKGAPTVVAAADGQAFVNSTGNPGMATAGMGDVLTGVIAGLAAQGLSPLDAAVAGVYLHGAAGDLAKSKLGEAGLLAGDVLHQLPRAMQQFEAQSESDIVFI